jgi:hypothetical protein
VSPFWSAQLVGWSLYVVINYLVSFGALAEPTAAAHVVLFGQKLIKGGIGLGMSLILALLYRRLWPRRWSIWPMALAGVAASLALGWIWTVLVRLAYLQTAFGGTFRHDYLTFTAALMAWTALYYSVNYRRELAAETERALRATALANEARLRMLRYQVNPHFLFNSLNSIRALIDEDPERARAMITELSEFFRYSLLDPQGADTTLSDELAAIRNYLAIQKIRFEEKLEVDLCVSPQAEAAQLPSFLVHPLVENALKYGLKTSPMPLRIAIVAEVVDGRLCVEVANTGHLVPESGKPNGAGTGTGLSNVRERLRHTYPGRHAFALDERDGWVRARLEVPS